MIHDKIPQPECEFSWCARHAELIASLPCLEASDVGATGAGNPPVKSQGRNRYRSGYLSLSQIWNIRHRHTQRVSLLVLTVIDDV